MYAVSQVVFVAVLVLAARALRRMHHPADGMALVGRYPARLIWRSMAYAVVGMLGLGAASLGAVLLSTGDVSIRLGALDSAALLYLMAEGIAGASRRAFAAVRADGIYLPLRTLRWSDVEEAWWDGAAMWVRLVPGAAVAPPLFPVLRDGRSFRGPQHAGRFVIIEGLIFRFSAAEYIALRNALPALHSTLREWRFGTGRAPLHRRITPAGRPVP